MVSAEKIIHKYVARFPERVWKDIYQLAHHNDCSKNDLIITALKKFISDNKNKLKKRK